MNLSITTHVIVISSVAPSASDRHEIRHEILCSLYKKENSIFFNWEVMGGWVITRGKKWRRSSWQRKQKLCK